MTENTFTNEEADLIIDALHRQQVAARFTAEDIADRILENEGVNPLGWEFNINEHGVRALVAFGVRIARGEVEIP